MISPSFENYCKNTILLCVPLNAPAVTYITIRPITILEEFSLTSSVEAKVEVVKVAVAAAAVVVGSLGGGEEADAVVAAALRQ